MGAQNFSDDNIFGLVNGVMFLVLPAFFLGAMAWAGIRVAEVVKGAMNNSVKPAQDAGAKGGQMAEKKINGAVGFAKGGVKGLLKKL